MIRRKLADLSLELRDGARARGVDHARGYSIHPFLWTLPVVIDCDSVRMPILLTKRHL